MSLIENLIAFPNATWKEIAVAGVIAAGVFIAYILLKPKPDPVIDPSEAEKLLSKWFGPASRATLYTFDEALGWVATYEALLNKGYKALIFKANNKVLANLTRNTGINFGGERFLVLLIMTDNWKEDSGSFKEVYRSSLVKYDRLDKRLEDELSEGDGVMKIGA